MSDSRSSPPRAGAEQLPVVDTEPTDDPVTRLFEQVDSPSAPPQPIRSSKQEERSGLGAARLVAIGMRRRVTVARRHEHQTFEAEVDPEVDQELVEAAFDEGQAVLVEWQPGALPVVVGILQTRAPDHLRLRARKIEIQADQELVLRSGRAGLSMEQGGRLELVGTYINAASRGIFRLVGRMLRLN